MKGSTSLATKTSNTSMTNAKQMIYGLLPIVREHPKKTLAVVIAGFAVIGGVIYVAKNSRNVSMNFAHVFGFEKVGVPEGADASGAEAAGDVEATHIGAKARADVSGAKAGGSVRATAVDASIPVETIDAVARLKDGRVDDDHHPSP